MTAATSSSAVTNPKPTTSVTGKAGQKRRTDQQIVTDWIEPGSRVLDLGCGRGVLLDHLTQTREARVLGVDNDIGKIAACVKRGVPAYHGDIDVLLSEMPDDAFDWVVCSRTVQDLENPAAILKDALRVARQVAVGFVNHAYWRNRLSVALRGSRVTNEVFPLSWDEGRPYNPVTVTGFEEFCAKASIHVEQAVYLRGDWETPLRQWPNLRAGYVLYRLGRTD